MTASELTQAKPGRRAPAAEPCTIRIGGKDGTPCTGDTVARITVACVHEHLGPETLCAEHLTYWDDVIRERRALCRHCYDGPGPHECRVSVVAREPLTGGAGGPE